MALFPAITDELFESTGDPDSIVFFNAEREATSHAALASAPNLKVPGRAGFDLEFEIIYTVLRGIHFLKRFTDRYLVQR